MAKIVAVDDEATVLDLIQQTLPAHTVLTAGDGVKGLALVQRELPDLVILDVSMPGQSGLVVCKSIKDGAATGRIPVLLLTAQSKMADVEKGAEAAADDYIVKPFEPRILSARVEQLLARAKR